MGTQAIIITHCHGYNGSTRKSNAKLKLRQIAIIGILEIVTMTLEAKATMVTMTLEANRGGVAIKNLNFLSFSPVIMGIWIYKYL
jgi:hypothetical protein